MCNLFFLVCRIGKSLSRNNRVRHMPLDCNLEEKFGVPPPPLSDKILLSLQAAVSLLLLVCIRPPFVLNSSTGRLDPKLILLVTLVFTVSTLVSHRTNVSCFEILHMACSVVRDI